MNFEEKVFLTALSLVSRLYLLLAVVFSKVDSKILLGSGPDLAYQFP
jgi:hypothetical protein